MKSNFFLLIIAFLLLIGPGMYAQETDSINHVDKNGYKQGKWKKLDNGILMYEGQFKDGKPVGTFVYYYPDSSKKTIMTFSNGGRKAFAINFHKKGTRLAEGKYFDRKKDSIWVYFNEKNVKVSEESYSNGVKDGPWSTFYPNGQVSEVTNYKNDIKNGSWDMFFSDGSKRSRASYVDGKLQGLIQFYYASGKVMVSGTYKNSMKNGIWITFKETGQTLKKETWKMGRLVEEVQVSEEDEVKKIRDEEE